MRESDQYHTDMFGAVVAAQYSGRYHVSAFQEYSEILMKITRRSLVARQIGTNAVGGASYTHFRRTFPSTLG